MASVHGGDSTLSNDAYQEVSLSFSIEPLAIVGKEAWPLVLENHEETGALRPELFNPNLNAYKELERMGVAVLYTARHQANLAGYALFLLNTHLHYLGTLFAFQDVFWMAPFYRRNHLVKAFMDYQEIDLARRRVKYIMRHAKPHRNYGAFLLAHGYHRHEVSYLKELSIGS